MGHQPMPPREPAQELQRRLCQVLWPSASRQHSLLGVAPQELPIEAGRGHRDHPECQASNRCTPRRGGAIATAPQQGCAHCPPSTAPSSGVDAVPPCGPFHVDGWGGRSGRGLLWGGGVRCMGISLSTPSPMRWLLARWSVLPWERLHPCRGNYWWRSTVCSAM